MTTFTISQARIDQAVSFVRQEFIDEQVGLAEFECAMDQPAGYLELVDNAFSSLDLTDEEYDAVEALDLDDKRSIAYQAYKPLRLVAQ